MPPRPLVIAHRGGAGEGPENTLVTLGEALRDGADGVECDVHLSGDGRLVVHHDPVLRLAPGLSSQPVPIASSSLAELRASNLGWTHGPRFSGLVVPTLEEVLELSPEEGLIMVELKTEPREELLTSALAQIMEAHPRRHRCLIGSFSPGLLGGLHARAGGLALVGIADEARQISSFAGLPLMGWALGQRIVDRALVRRLHRSGRQVWTWTVASAAEIGPLVEAGVDGLITDIPRATLRCLGR